MIRFADFDDYDRLMELMINFANSAPIDSLHNPDYEDRRIRHFLTNIMRSGVILVAEENNQVQGMIIAQIQPDSWLPYVKTLRELAWWVEPEYRNTTMGYRLLKKYTEVGRKMQEHGDIDQFTLTLMTNSPELKLDRRGWRPIETNYVYEGVN